MAMTSGRRPLTEEEKFDIGPFSVLSKAVKTQAQIMIHCRNNRKLVGRVKMFDRHCNMVLQDVTEYTDPKSKNAPFENRFISKMFLRGDTVILVLYNPNEPSSSSSV